MATCPSCRKRYPDDVTTCEVDGDTLLPNEAFTGLDADLQAGATVGEYRIEAKLGEGGFGCVYRAVHPLIGKPAAIKVLNRQYSSNPQMVSRFIAEARAVNQIRHKGIIDIFAFGAIEDGRQYYVMELLEGTTLDAYIKQKGRISIEEAIPIFRSVSRALDAAHAAGIAHRDLKPENVFLVFDDEGEPVPKLLDFGIAKLMGDSAMHHKTRTGTPMGTPHYMSPEQCRGKNVDHRTDVYSFGILIHQVLTGQLPFDGDDVMELLVKQTTATPPPMSTVNAALPAALDAPVLHMLHKDPNERPTSVSVAVEALAEAAKGAGFDVKVVPVKSGEQRKVVTGPGGKMTPSEIGVLAEARTMVQGQNPTLLNAEADVKPSGGRRTALLVGVAFAVLGIAVGLGVAMRPSSADGPAATARGEPPPTPTPPPTPKAEPAASASSPVVTPVVHDVEITVQSTPPGADVFLGTERLGKAPGPFKLKKGEDKVRLTIKADGYKPIDVDLTPSANVVLPVALGKLGGPGGGKPIKKPGSGELEF